MSAAVTAAQVTDALRGVIDPELGLSVVDLGLIYAVTVDDGHVRVRMTLTAPGCPLHAVMPGWVLAAVRGIPGVRDAEVELTFDPPWTPDRMRSSGGSRKTPPIPPPGGADRSTAFGL